MQNNFSAQLFQFTDKLADVAFAAPVVASHRLCRMACTGLMSSGEDRAELSRMVDEKGRAFLDSWTSMGVQATVATNLFSSCLAWAGMRPWSATQADWCRGQQAWIDAPEKGLDPLRQTVLANAKRLKHQPI